MVQQEGKHPFILGVDLVAHCSNGLHLLAEAVTLESNQFISSFCLNRQLENKFCVKLAAQVKGSRGDSQPIEKGLLSGRGDAENLPLPAKIIRYQVT